MSNDIALPEFWNENRACTACEIRQKCEGPVPGNGNLDARIMLVGEAPGQKEDESGFAFQGPAGARLTELLDSIGISRDEVWITNTVKCRPSKTNSTPKPDQAKVCAELWLEREIDIVQPEVIVALGAVATNYFAEDSVSVEAVHGNSIGDYRGADVFSVYHPAAAMHNPNLKQKSEEDFQALAKLLSGENPTVHDAYPDPVYRWVDCIEDKEWEPVTEQVSNAELVAVDVELLPPYAEHRLFGFSFSMVEGEAYLLPPTEENLRFLKWLCEAESIRKVLHNAIGVDIQTLRNYGIELRNYDDTMVRAYELNWYPQSLKALCRRHLGMKMIEYDEIMAESRRRKTYEYFQQIVGRKWPDPDPVLEERPNPKTKELEYHVRQPKNIEGKIKQYLKGTDKSPDYDLWGKWAALTDEERHVVESVLGPLEEVSLQDVIDDGKKDLVIWYAARDADATLRLCNLMQAEIEANALDRVLSLDTGALDMVVDMMQNGIAVDIPHFEEFAKELEAKMADAAQRAQDAAGVRFQLSSPQQVSAILYDRLNLRVSDGFRRQNRKLLNKKSTDKIVLKEMEKENPDSPTLKALMEYRTASKLWDTYAVVIPRKADENNRVHTTFKVTRTETGRLASADPNLMNQPTRTAEGKRIREGFVARPGWVLMSVDLSQIEVRIIAHRSADPNMVNAFRTGQDIYISTASEVEEVVLAAVTKEQRQEAKSVVLGLGFGETPHGLANDVGKSIAWAEDYMASYFRKFPLVRDLIQQTQIDLLRDGYVSDMIGRRRYFPVGALLEKRDWLEYERGFIDAAELLRRANKNPLLSEALKQATNMPVQSSAQIPVKHPMKQLREDFKMMGISELVLPLIQIHDELMYEVREDTWELAADMTKFRMENAFEDLGIPFSVPVLAEAKLGHRWGSMKEMTYKDGSWVEKE